MGSDRRALRSALVLLAALLAAPAARAQQAPTPAEKETARSQMNEGRARRDRDDLRGALESFRAADAIMHVPTTGFELARTLVALGQLVEARDTLRALLRSPTRADDPRPFVEARANAQALDDELSQRIPSIKLVLDGPSSGSPPEVHVDGVAIPADAAREALKVNPGHHAIVAVAGGATGRAEIDVAEREARTVQVRLTAAAPEPIEPAHVEPAPASGEGPHTARTFAIAGLGLAAVGLAVGSVTGLMSISKTSAVKSSCVDNHCPASSAGDLDTARGTATVSTIAFAAAGVGIAVGVGALLIGDRPASPRPEATAARVTPWIGLGAAGVRGSF